MSGDHFQVTTPSRGSSDEGPGAAEPWSALSGPHFQTRRTRDATLEKFRKEVEGGRATDLSRDDLMALLEMARRGNTTMATRRSLGCKDDQESGGGSGSGPGDGGAGDDEENGGGASDRDGSNGNGDAFEEKDDVPDDASLRSAQALERLTEVLKTAQRQTVVLAPQGASEAKAFKAPSLTTFEVQSRRKFCLIFDDYLQEIKEYNDRHQSQLVLPTIKSCIPRKKLRTVCRRLLTPEHRNDDTTKVPDAVIERFVRQKDEYEDTDEEDDPELVMELLRKVRMGNALSQPITALAEYQEGLDRIFERFPDHNLQDKTIISLINDALQPEAVYDHMRKELLRKSNKRATKRLSAFWALLERTIKKLAKASRALGSSGVMRKIGGKRRKRETRETGGEERGQRRPKDEPGGREKPTRSPEEEKQFYDKLRKNTIAEFKKLKPDQAKRFVRFAKEQGARGKNKKGRRVKACFCCGAMGDKYHVVSECPKANDFEKKLPFKGKDGDNKSWLGYLFAARHKVKCEEKGVPFKQNRVVSAAHGTCKINDVTFDYFMDDGSDYTTCDQAMLEAMGGAGRFEKIKPAGALVLEQANGEKVATQFTFRVPLIRLLNSRTAAEVRLKNVEMAVIDGDMKALIIGRLDAKRLGLFTLNDQLQDRFNQIASEGSKVVPCKVSRAVFEAADPDAVLLSEGVAYVGENGFEQQYQSNVIFEPTMPRSAISRPALRYSAKGDFEENDAHEPARFGEELIHKLAAADPGRFEPKVIGHTGAPVRVCSAEDPMVKIEDFTWDVFPSTLRLVLIGRDLLSRFRGTDGIDADPLKTDPDAAEMLARLLDEMLDHARLAGACDEFLEEATKKILEGPLKPAFAVNLGHRGPAHIPPLPVTKYLKESWTLPPHPGVRPCNPEKLRWLRGHLEKLEEYNVARRSTSKALSAANLVEKTGDREFADKYRLTVDDRRKNELMFDFVQRALPNLQRLFDHLAGAKFYSKADFIKGFWQCPVEESWPFAFTTPLGNYEFLVAPMGHLNSPPWFQKCMEGVFEDDLYKRLLLLLDDALLYAKTQMDLWRAIEHFLTRCVQHNLRLHPKKFVLFKKALVWGGWLLRGDTVAVDPARTQALLQMPKPGNLAELMQALCAANWTRAHQPLFKKITAPLFELQRKAMERFVRKTKCNAAKISCKQAGWNETHDDAWDAFRLSIAKSVSIAVFDPQKQTHLFSDASLGFWSIVITQTPCNQVDLPINEQDHVPLVFASGAFKNSQRRWKIESKEGFPIVHAFKTYGHFLGSATRPPLVWCDHKNIVYIFSPAARPLTTRLTETRRLARWQIVLVEFDFIIQHIDGDANLWADLLTRWGAPQLKLCGKCGALMNEPLRHFCGEDEEAAPPTVARPKAVGSQQRRLIFDETCAERGGFHGSAAPTATPAGGTTSKKVRFAPAKLLVTAPPKATGNAVESKFDVDVTETLHMPIDPSKFPHFKMIKNAQDEYLPEDDQPPLKQGDSGLQEWGGRVYIPTQAKELKLLLMAVAHQGPEGAHRGTTAGLQRLREHCTWRYMTKEYTEFVSSCLCCLKLRGGGVIPRPMGHQMHAEKVGELVHLDFIHMPVSEDGYRYVLMILDDLSKVVLLTAARSDDAITTAKALLRWSAFMGTPEYLCSDNGTHFKNRLIKALQSAWRYKHHFTLARTSHNHTVERENRWYLENTRALLKDLRLRLTQWPDVLLIQNVAMNTHKRPILKNKTPLGVAKVINPTGALNHVFWRGHEISKLDVENIATEKVQSIMLKATDEIHALKKMWAVLAKKQQERRANSTAAADKANDGPALPAFETGHYVMMGKRTRKKSKLEATWKGPFEVIGTACESKGTLVYNVRKLGDTAILPVHASRLAHFASDKLNVTAELKDWAQDGEYTIAKLVDFEEGDDEKLHLRVRWMGFEPADDTWEPIEQLIEDQPKMVLKFLKTRKDAHDAVAGLIKKIRKKLRKAEKDNE